MKAKRFACTGVLLLFGVVAGAGAADEQAEKDALQAAEAWLELVDKGDYAASWDQAASLFKAAVKKETWQEQISAGRNPLGRLVSRRAKTTKYTTSLPGAPDGEYVVIQFETSSFSIRRDISSLGAGR